MTVAAPGRRLVIDASGVVDLVTRRPDGPWVADRVAGHRLAGPAHLKAEVLSAVARRYRAGAFTAEETHAALDLLVRLPMEEHAVSGLIPGAWRRRDQLRLADALYVELAEQLATVVVTTDRRLARATSLAVAPPGQ